MKFAFPAMAGLAALALAVPALAQPSATDTPANTACRVEKPTIPAVDWSGQASYRAVSTVKDGRVVAVEITSLKGGVDRRAQRSLVHAIEQVLRTAACPPGDYQFARTFSFDIPKAPTPAMTASDATS